MPSAFGKPVTTANRFGVVATPSVWTLVTTLTASNSSSLTVTGLASTSYKNYALVFSGLLPAGASSFYVYYSTDNGATFPTGATSYDYIWAFNAAGTVLHAFNDLGSFGYLLSTVSSDTRTSAGGVAYFTYGVVASARAQLTGTLTSYNGTRQEVVISASNYNSATEVNALRFLMTGGNITNGTIKVYGIT